MPERDHTVGDLAKHVIEANYRSFDASYIIELGELTERVVKPDQALEISKSIDRLVFLLRPRLEEICGITDDEILTSVVNRPLQLAWNGSLEEDVVRRIRFLANVAQTVLHW